MWTSQSSLSHDRSSLRGGPAGTDSWFWCRCSHWRCGVGRNQRPAIGRRDRGRDAEPWRDTRAAPTGGSPASAARPAAGLSAEVLGLDVETLGDVADGLHGDDAVVAVVGWYVASSNPTCPSSNASEAPSFIVEVGVVADLQTFCPRSGVLLAAPFGVRRRTRAVGRLHTRHRGPFRPRRNRSDLCACHPRGSSGPPRSDVQRAPELPGRPLRRSRCLGGWAGPDAEHHGPAGAAQRWSAVGLAPARRPRRGHCRPDWSALDGDPRRPGDARRRRSHGGRAHHGASAAGCADLVPACPRARSRADAPLWVAIDDTTGTVIGSGSVARSAQP